MKKIYSLLTLFFAISLLTSAYAQISISKFSLPDVGKTLKTHTVAFPSVDLGTIGGSQVWDFSDLNTVILNEVELLPPSEGSVEVPGATFMIQPSEIVEQYYKKSDQNIEEIYIKTVDPLFNTLEISRGYAKNPVYRKATIIFGQEYSSESEFQTPIAWDDLPDTLTGSIGLDLDSIRFNTNLKRTDKIDAWGTVKLPDGEWEVLRESTSIERSSSIDVFIFGFWIAAPADILETFLGDFAAIFAPDTTYMVNFYTDEAIEVLASFRLSEEGGDPITVDFKAGSTITDIDYISYYKDPSVSIYPNPSYGNVSFEFSNCRLGTYTIQIYDVLGKSMWESEYLLKENNKPFKTDLSSLRKGTYLYTINDPAGNKIATKRLVIINP